MRALFDCVWQWHLYAMLNPRVKRVLPQVLGSKPPRGADIAATHVLVRTRYGFHVCVAVLRHFCASLHTGSAAV